MASKGARLRAKRDRQDDMGLAPTPRRKPRGRKRMDQIVTERKDDNMDAFITRCRQKGIEPSDSNLRDMAAPWNGCEAGKAMARHVATERDRQRLWDAIQHVRTAWARYASLHGLPQRSAQCLRIMLPVDEMHADASTPAADLRTLDERQKAALRVWREAEILIGRWGRNAASITSRCVLDDERCEDATSMCLSLWNVADHLEGAR